MMSIEFMRDMLRILKQSDYTVSLLYLNEDEFDRLAIEAGKNIRDFNKYFNGYTFTFEEVIIRLIPTTIEERVKKLEKEVFKK